MRRYLVILLALALMAPAVCAGEEPAAAFAVMGYDDADTYRDWSANQFFARLAERTGVAFTFRQYTKAAEYRAALSALRPDGDLPDVLFKASLSPSECMDLLDRGVLIDLKPLIAQHAPHLAALIRQDTSVLDAITLPDGRIAALPFINDAPAQNVLWINQDWLKALKLDMPTTADELTGVLQAFKTGDPNRNGKADEVPLAFLGVYDLKYLAHAYGMIANDFNVFERDGQAVFMPLEPSFRPFVAWLRALYEQKLLHRDGFTTVDALRRVSDAKATPVFGALFAPLISGVLPAEWTDSYRALPPLVYEGRQVYRTIADAVTAGTFAVTTACKDPAAALHWVDYLYSEEGSILALAGQEGVDYLMDGDGTWRKTELASQPGYLSEYGIMTGSALPGISNDAFQRKFSDATVRKVSEQIDVVAAVAANPFPIIPLTGAQTDEIAPLQAAIGRYVDESIARWVIGEWELTDEQFGAFSKQLDELGLAAFMRFWQDALDGRQEGAHAAP